MTVSVPFTIARARSARRPHSVFRGEATISGWSIDSRTLGSGRFAFFALRGPTHDGHDHVSKAFEQGASLAIVEHLTDVAGLQLVVADTTVALEQLGRAVRDRWTGTVIAVTGSAGKTTTKDTIASLVATRCRTGRTIGNFNNHLGVPLSILRLPDDARVAVLELGMNHAGEIRSLARIAKPLVGVVTNVGWAHTENFEDGIEGVARAKRELIEELPADGVAVLNADDPHVREFAKVHPGPKYSGSDFAEDAEVRAEDVEYLGGGRAVPLPWGRLRFAAGGPAWRQQRAGRHRSGTRSADRARNAARCGEIACRRQDARRADRTKRRSDYQRLL